MPPEQQTYPHMGMPRAALGARGLWRYSWLLAFPGAISVLMLAGLLVWHCLGAAHQEGRQADLLMVGLVARDAARKGGTYPSDLIGAVREARMQGFVDPKDLVYPAGGQPYDPKDAERAVRPGREKAVLFCEREPRRYGLDRGRFIVYRDLSVAFCRDAGT